MTAAPEPMGQPLQHEVQHLLADVTGPDAGSQTAETVELTLVRRRLAMSAALGRRCCGTRAAGRPAAPVLAPDGPRLTAPAQRPTTDEAVLGQGHVARHAFTAPGRKGHCPRDAALR